MSDGVRQVMRMLVTASWSGLVGLLIGAWITRRIWRGRIVGSLSRAQRHMVQFSKGDQRRSFWHGSENALSRFLFWTYGDDDEVCNKVWLKLRERGIVADLSKEDVSGEGNGSDAS